MRKRAGIDNVAARRQVSAPNLATRIGNRERARRAVYATFAIAMLVGIYIAVAATGIIPRITPVSALAQG